ncbi:AcrR family transcriptional regulator [Streptosporangium album]|uniref:AcrR family transcriptional regulator n=1 Tax=Streptosporangium album TaxID=47479 RepID=A0A7W7RQW9_9ACTN|nr:TetR family transcriptional regulator [Streptosporangium album]MBB4936531.1 AcrR family transcriptional regulator [Streptosporangium album]
MRSAHSSGPPSADLTAQAKIRNAAIAHFVRDGFQKANLRAIAATAGVSAGLVIHHFGSKEGLRSVCDEYVLQVLVQRAHDDARPAGMQDVLRDYLSNPDAYRLQVQYMARAIEDDSPAAGTFVNTMVDESEAIIRAGIADGTMRPSSDPRALAVLSVLTSLAMLTMAPPLARSLGYESFGPEVLRRMALPSLELYTRGLYTDDAPLKAARDALADPDPQQQKKD